MADESPAVVSALQLADTLHVADRARLATIAAFESLAELDGRIERSELKAGDIDQTKWLISEARRAAFDVSETATKVAEAIHEEVQNRLTWLEA